MNKLKNYYLSEWRFFRKKLLPLFLLVVFCFVALALATYLFHKGDPEGLKVWFEKFLERFAPYENLPPVLSFLKYLWNNSGVALLCILWGFIPFVFLPLFSMINNALFGGKFFAFFIEKTGISSVLATTLPHAIIEIPVLLYAVSLGLLLCFQRSRRIIKKRQMQETVFGQQVVISSEHDLTFRRLTRIFLLIIAPLLLLAAFIEAFITPLIMGLLA